jgi:hypothetical protein
MKFTFSHVFQTEQHRTINISMRVEKKLGADFPIIENIQIQTDIPNGILTLNLAKNDEGNFVSDSDMNGVISSNLSVFLQNLGCPNTILDARNVVFDASNHFNCNVWDRLMDHVSIQYWVNQKFSHICIVYENYKSDVIIPAIEAPHQHDTGLVGIQFIDLPVEQV